MVSNHFKGMHRKHNSMCGSPCQRGASGAWCATCNTRQPHCLQPNGRAPVVVLARDQPLVDREVEGHVEGGVRPLILDLAEPGLAGDAANGHVPRIKGGQVLWPITVALYQETGTQLDSEQHECQDA